MTTSFLPAGTEVVIHSQHATIDGLTGKASVLEKENMLRLELTEDAPMADLENGAIVYLPLANILYLTEK
jgi:hypothetical protein